MRFGLGELKKILAIAGDDDHSFSRCIAQRTQVIGLPRQSIPKNLDFVSF